MNATLSARSARRVSAIGRFSSLLLFLLMTATAAHAQAWERLPGPAGGSINALLTVGDTVYASTGSLFRSVDRGVVWTRVDVPPSTGLTATSPWIQALARDHRGGIVALGMYDLFRSSDGGRSWRTIDAMRPNNAKGLVVGADGSVFTTRGGTLYRLRPGTTGSVPAGPSGSVTVVGVAPGSGAVYAIGARNRVWRSDDDGDSWAIVNAAGDSTLPAIRTLAVLTDGRLLGGTDSGLLTSVDEGASWRADTTSIRERTILSIMTRGGLLFVGTDRFGPFRSSDGGATWQQIPYGLDNPSVPALAASSPFGRIYAGTAAGVHYSDDAGTSWTLSVTGMNGVAPRALAITPNDHLFLGTEAGIARSTDDGTSWAPVNYGLDARSTRAIVVDSAGALVALSAQAVISRSTDDGNSWQRAGAIEGWDRVWTIAVTADGDLVAVAYVPGGSRGAVLRSTDGGARWSQVLDVIDPIGFTVPADGSLIAMTYNGGIYRSTSNGATWSLVAPRRGVDELMSIGADGHGGVFAGGRYYLWRSFDNGVTWTQTYVGPNLHIGSMAVTRDGSIVAGIYGPSSEAMISKNAGTTWSDASSGLNGEPPSSLRLDSDATVYGLLAEGLVRSTWRLVSSVEIAGTTSSVSIDMPRPHPVRGTSRVGFRLDETSPARLSLFDMRGIEVLVLFDGSASPGRREVTLDARGLASGVYAMRLQTNSGVRVERIVVE